MSFCDFKGIWRVTEVNGVNETVGHWIAIGGTSTNVKVMCLQDPFSHIHGNFTYQADPEQLNTNGARIIRPTPSQVKYETSGLPGSWTADDNLG